MQRRTFLHTTLATTAAGITLPIASPAAEQRGKEAPELYEFRSYTLKPEKQALLDDYLSKAFIPAVKRAGSGPVGVFHEKAGASLRVNVLIVHSSAEQFGALAGRLGADAQHQKDGADYLAALAGDPIYARIESSLSAAISGMPKLARPDNSKPRLFNLRIYESHNERAGKKKIEMFNQGELAIFRRVGLTPVFFGETIAGAAMPNLTYLLVYPGEEPRKEAWGKFGKDPEWQKLRAMPGYADKEIVSRITNRLMEPAPYSEI